MDSQLVPTEVIVEKILLIRGQKVILDRDLAKLYGVKTIRLREQVKRNIDRFPEDFMFQLSSDESEILVSQNAIPSRQSLGGHLPYVFTEHGAIMLASVLNTTTAVKVSVFVVRAFVRLRELLITHKDLMHKIEELERKSHEHDYHISSIFETIKELLTPPAEEKKKIGFLQN